MDKYEKLQKLQELKENGTMTEAEFENEKAKLLNTTKIKIPKWLSTVIMIIVVIAIFAGIGKLSEYFSKQDLIRETEKWELDHYGENKTTTSINTHIK